MILMSDRATVPRRHVRQHALAATAMCLVLVVIGAGCAGSSGGQLDTAAGTPTGPIEVEIPLSDAPQTDNADHADNAPVAVDTPDPDALPTPLTQAPSDDEPGAEPTPLSSGSAGTPSNDSFLPAEAAGFWRVTGDGPVNARLTPGLSGEIVGTLQSGDSQVESTGRRALVDGVEWKELAPANQLPIVWMAANLLVPDQTGRAPGSNAATPTVQSSGLDGLVFGVDEVVRFGAGSTSTTISDAVVRGERSRYRLGAGAGQTLNLDITSLEANAVFDVFDANGQLIVGEQTTASVNLPATGEYTIVVGSTRGNASYKLTVSIPA